MKATYSFYSDHFIYSEYYRKFKSFKINYSDVINIDYFQSISQKRIGLGTISISTRFPSKTYNLSDVPEPDSLFKQIEAIVERKL